MTERQTMQRELAIRAQQGDKEAQGQLWENVKRLLFKMCVTRYLRLEEQAIRSGATLEDFQQLAWFAYLDALKAYDPDKGYVFTTYLDYHVIHHTSVLLGLRGRQDPLNSYCSSLNASLDGDDPDGSSLQDIIADEHDPIEEAETNLYREQLHQAVESYLSAIPDKERWILRLLYFDGKTLQEASDIVGISVERVRELRNKALRRGSHGLQRKHFEGFAEYRKTERECRAYKNTTLGLFHRKGVSSVELAVEALERLEQEWAEKYSQLW